MTSCKDENTIVKDIKTGEEKNLEVDSIILSVGYQFNNQLYESIRNLNSMNEIYNIGDSRNIANIYFAIHDAYEIVNNIQFVHLFPTKSSY